MRLFFLLFSLKPPRLILETKCFHRGLLKVFGTIRDFPKEKKRIFYNESFVVSRWKKVVFESCAYPFEYFLARLRR